MTRIRNWQLPALAAGTIAAVAGVLAGGAIVSPAYAGVLSERDSDYQWRLCPAARLIPLRPGYTDPDTNPENTEIRADASRLVEDGVSQFSGDVEVIRGDTSLRAEVITYDDASNVFDAEGRTHIWDAGLVWGGERATYDLESRVSTLYEGRYWLANGRGRGHAALLTNDRIAQVTTLEGVDYTTCPESDETWRISAARIKLDHESDRGSATHAVLRVKDVPVFYFPYVNFPISDKRKSGFLAPSVGTTNDSGIDLRIPYYWNIAPNQDATITPRALSDRGPMLETEYRYLGRTIRSEAHVEYLPGDNLENDRDRSLISFEHDQRLFDNHGKLYVLFNDVSDDEFFEDFGSNISVTSQRFLDRQALFTYRVRGRHNLRAQVQAYQTIDDSIRPGAGPYRKLPQISYLGNGDGWRGVHPSVYAQTTYFHRDAGLTGGRVKVAPTLAYNVVRPWMALRQRLTLDHTQYLLDDPAGFFDDSESRTLPVYSLDATLFAERRFGMFGGDFLQTLEPRLFYLLVPKYGQEHLPRFDGGLLDVSFRNIFRENRFSGGDRIGDANQLTAAVTSRIIDAASGREAFRLNLGQIYYFRDREVTLPGRDIIDDSVSELIAEAAANLGQDWSVRGTVQWDPNQPRTEKSAISLRYRPNIDTVVNFAYRQRRAVTDIEQTDVSLRIPLLDNIAVIGRWNYSLPESQTLEAIAGVEYESCCWGLRLVARRFLRNSAGAYDNNIFLQFQFRGLGGFGRKSGSFLRRGIAGYYDPFE